MWYFVHYYTDEELTQEELMEIFGERRCKPEPVEPCQESKHGCCPDNFHSAKGPFYEGDTSFIYITTFNDVHVAITPGIHAVAISYHIYFRM